MWELSDDFYAKKKILFGTSGGHLQWFVLTEILILHTFFLHKV